MNTLWPMIFCLFLLACHAKDHSILTIQASAFPQAEILHVIKDDLEKEGVHLRILIVDDYNLPNRALAEGEIDANFFQHCPFLQEQIAQFHYPLAALTEVHIEPMGLYLHAKKLSLNAKISLPNDPTNQTRALLLLEKGGYIRLDARKNILSTLDIVENPLHLQFYEVDAALLARTLDDVDASIIPTNYALTAKLSPIHDAILKEDASSLYANIIAIRKTECDRPELLLLKKYVTSKKVQDFINTHYEGAVLPVY